MKSIALDDREKELLLFVGTRRIGTQKTIARGVYGSADQPALDAAERAIKRLQGTYLQVFTLYGSEKYCMLMKAGTRLLGFHEEAASHLGAQALSKHYAILHFTSMRIPVFKRVTRFNTLKDLGEELFPNKNAFYSDYYYGFRGQDWWLGRMQVDFGGDARRFLVSSNEIIAEMKARPTLNELIECNLVRFTIITADQAKKESMEVALKAKPLELPWYIHVAPELLSLIGQQVLQPRGKAQAASASPLQLSLEQSSAD
jgi:hypothetical protein